jgi:hypothetical protein
MMKSFEEQCRNVAHSLCVLEDFSTSSTPTITLSAKTIKEHLATVQQVPASLEWMTDDHESDIYDCPAMIRKRIRLAEQKDSIPPAKRELAMQVQASCDMWTSMYACQKAMTTEDYCAWQLETDKTFGVNTARAVSHRTHLTQEQNRMLDKLVEAILPNELPENKHALHRVTARAEIFSMVADMEKEQTDVSALAAKASAIAAIGHSKLSNSFSKVSDLLAPALMGHAHLSGTHLAQVVAMYHSLPAHHKSAMEPRARAVVENRPTMGM